MTKRGLGICMAVAFLGCAQPQRQEVLDVLHAQREAWNAGSVEGYMEGYWDAPDLTFVSGGTVTKGYDVVLERYRSHYSSPVLMGKLSFTDEEVRFLSESSAIVTGQWRLARQNDEPWGRFTLLLQKKPGGWKIVYDHTSSGGE